MSPCSPPEGIAFEDLSFGEVANVISGQDARGLGNRGALFNLDKVTEAAQVKWL